MSDIERLIDAIENIKALDKEQHERLEQLIKNNYSSLAASINEIKEDLKTLKLSDKDQQVEIAKLWANADNLEKEFQLFQKSEKTYGRQVSAEIAKLKALPWKIAGLLTGAMGVLIAGAGLVIKYLL